MVQDKMVIPPELVDHIFNAEMDEAFEEDLKNLQVKLAFVDAGVGSWVGNGGFRPLRGRYFAAVTVGVLDRGSRAYREMAREIGSLRAKAVRANPFQLRNNSHRAADKIIIAACGG